MNFNCAVSIYPEASRNAFGEKVWGSKTDVKARVVEKSMEVLDNRGEKTYSDIIVHLPLNTSIAVGSKVEFNDVDYLVLQVSKPKNEVGHIRDIKLICKKYGED